MAKVIVILFLFALIFTLFCIAISRAFGPLPVDMRIPGASVFDLEISSATASNSKFSQRVILEKLTVNGNLYHLDTFK